MRQAAIDLLWDEPSGSFVRTLQLRDGTMHKDMIMDASLVGLWSFGMLAPDDPQVTMTMEAMRQRLWVRTEVGGLARYENDYYHQVSQDIEKVPGNPWFICTLWLAQWYIATAKTTEGRERSGT